MKGLGFGSAANVFFGISQKPSIITQPAMLLKPLVLIVI